MGKKGGSNTTTNVQSYTPTEQEIRLQKQAADYSEAVAPNALKLNNIAGDLLYGSYGAVQADYNKANQNAQYQTGLAQSGVGGLINGQMAGIQSGVGNLINGQLPQAYQDNMNKSIASAVDKSVGTTVNDLGNRGVLNSSVTTKALNDASANAANAAANQYSNNIGMLSGLYNQQLNGVNATSGLYGQQAGLASQPIAVSAAAQEAAQQPAMNLWLSSLGLNNSTLGALSGLAGKGTSTATSTQKTSGGGLFGSLLSGAASFIG